MAYPADLRYTRDHEWVRLDADGQTATIGITDFAQGELGDIVYVTMPTVGATFAAEETFGDVEAVKTVSDLFMPVSGTIVAVNESLNDAPEAVNTDPYGDGWLVKISLADSAELDGLLSAEDYAAHVG
ncbi:MAG: glycine cleavage system protein GcvH [Rhodothermales bacterium]|nr:glycine cleavage system protein GcvH [Rhodothermales bacterium]MCA0268197.1 glycine cleavage system protein GcvH [Bacteroidota bacterium]